MSSRDPLCPIDPRHGRMLDVRDSKSSWAWYCPHQLHDNTRSRKFFTDKEAHGEYELEEQDVTLVFEGAAHDVIAGKITLDQAVTEISRTTQRSTQQTREALTIMIATIEERDTDMAEKKAAAKAAKAKTAAKPAGSGRRLEHVDGAEFKAVLDEFGLTNKQAAEATGAAGMGKSSTYIYILIHDGSSAVLFAKFEAAVKAYVKENGIKRPRVKPAEATAAAPAKAVTPKVAAAKAAPAKPAAKAPLKPKPKAAAAEAPVAAG